MKFDLKEKMAIVKMSYSVILADGKVHASEIAALHQLKFKMGFDTDFISDAQNMDHDKALVILNKMDYNKKQALASILGDIAIADEQLHENEMRLIIDVFKNIGIGEELE